MKTSLIRYKKGNKNSNMHKLKRLTSVSALGILQCYQLSYSLVRSVHDGTLTRTERFPASEHVRGKAN